MNCFQFVFVLRFDSCYHVKTELNNNWIFDYTVPHPVPFPVVQEKVINNPVPVPDPVAVPVPKVIEREGILQIYNISN